jgi:hypothetical protein
MFSFEFFLLWVLSLVFSESLFIDNCEFGGVIKIDASSTIFILGDERNLSSANF